MNIRKFFFLSSVICVILVLTSILFFRAILAKPIPDIVNFEKIDTYIEQQMDRLHIPGAALAIVEDDKIVHLRGFGQARPGGKAPSPRTSFVLGSTTKSFTALAIMQLVDAGKIKLDAPVQRYLPWFRVANLQASAQITVRHLLNQTSGLPQSSGLFPMIDFDNMPDACERQARALTTLEMTREVGSAFEYSNMNYNLLGLIIQAASGESYEVYVQNHIFAPLGMRYSYTSQSIAKENGLAVGSRYWFAFPFAKSNLSIPRGSLPSGYLISSSEDMAHYLIAHLNEGRYGKIQILSPAGIYELHRPAVQSNLNGILMGHYGMGWFIQEIDRTKIIWHNGLVPNFFSYIGLLPEQNKGVVLLINANHLMMHMALTEVGMGVATWLATGQPAPIRLGVVPWVLRGLLLIPLLQIISVAATLRLLHRWRQGSKRRPSREYMWVRHILLPVTLNLLVAFFLLGGLRRLQDLLGSGPFALMLLSMPDFSWIALICGGFSLVWTFLHSGLILWALRTRSSFQT